MANLEGALAVTRFGLGAQRGEIDIASRGPKAWLEGQLKTPSDVLINDPAFKGLASSRDIFRVYQDYKDKRKIMREADKPAASKAFSDLVKNNFYEEIQARAVYAAGTRRPFHERLTRFWSNHFSISARNRTTRLWPGVYEREAIRPHILGRFSDLASKAIFHQGMLVFLDNVGSVGPRSRKGINADKGLNENLAREVLELHTVTLAADYTQADVTEFAKALTGWTINGKANYGAPIGTVTFRSFYHEPGRRTVLGQKYPKGLIVSEKQQAPQILKDLCARPETAENIAVKLATHFVSDDPPQDLIKALKARFLETEGDLTALYKVLIHSPHAWTPAAQKVKSPEELLISTARMIGVKNTFTARPRDTYDSLAQSPFTAPTPEGWPDKASAWIGPDAILKRIEWANKISSKIANIDAGDFLQSALGARVSVNTLQAVSRAESVQQARILALMSPEFQRR